MQRGTWRQHAGSMVRRGQLCIESAVRPLTKLRDTLMRADDKDHVYWTPRSDDAQACEK
jgi:hypothetical protein